MKIHGTAKGGALSKKDFGVAFGGGGAWDVNWNFDESDLEAYWDLHFPSTDETNLDVNTTTDKIDWKMINDNNDQTMYNDLLGEDVNNSQWLLRMKLRFSDVDASNACQGFIGISSINGASNSTQDFIGVGILTSDNQIRSIEADGSAISMSGDENASITWAINTDYYLQIIRSSSTAYSCEIFSDSDFSTSVAKVDGTAPSSIQDLRYVKLQNRIDENDGEPVLAIDFIRFENNAVLPPE